MILIMNILIAYLLRRRYTTINEWWGIKSVYYLSCLVFTPFFGIPFFKLLGGQFRGTPWSRIYEPEEGII